MATIIYDFTVEFCNLFVSPNRTNESNRSYRMVDQMVQAARSNKQNIVEGSSEPVSKKSEIKLLGVARASFQELLEDYEDFLRQRGLRQWDKDSNEAREVRDLAYKSDRSYETYKSYLASPESAANTAICAINQASYLLDRQIRALEEKFVREGGWTEKMFNRRISYRTNRTDKTNNKTNRSNFIGLIGLIGIGLIGLIVPSAAFAASNTVLDFDGNDYLVASDNAVFDQADRLSISVWAKPDVAGDDYILHRSGAYYLKLTSSSTIEGAIYYSADFHTVESSAITVDGSKWTHIEMTYDKTDGKLKIFLNGELDKSADYSTSVAAAATALYIGADSTPANYFDGQIDDVRLYQYARTPSDVRLDYNEGFAARFGGRGVLQYTPTEDCSLDPASCMDYGLVGYWNMDEGSGTIAYDASDNSNDGTLTNSPKWSEGKEGGGLDFDSINDYVVVDHTTELIPDTVSVSAWVYITKADVSQHIVSKWMCYALRTSNQGPKDTLFFTIWDGNTGYETVKNNQVTGFNLNEWIHVVGTYDGANVKLYLNGNEITTVTTAHSGIIDDDANDIQFGRYQGGTGFFGGAVDDVRIYNRALSAEEVRYHYNRGGPVGHWKFDEGEGQTAYDETSNNNDGTLGDGTCLPGAGTCPAWVEGKHASALSFDGGDYIDVNTITLADDASWTFSTWIQPDSVDDKGIYGNALASSNYTRLFLRTNEIYIYNDSNSKICDFSQTATVGVWQLLTIVRDEEVADFRLYLNGVYKETYNADLDTSQTIKMIGGLGSTSSNLFDGTIDDVRIYNYAHTQEQILMDYNAGLATHIK